uniref:Uncharacterized protein n=1 Tax=Clastoptera arizonana TaxID=38151 RepID=A0A1B6DW91_9HEMI
MQTGQNSEQNLCIEKESYKINNHYTDRTEMVLFTYASRNKNATVNNILQALMDLHRWDIVLYLLKSKYIFDLANKVNSKYENSNSNCDSIINKDSCKINGIIPLNHKFLADQLPMTLNENLKPEQYGFNPINIPNEFLQKSKICQNSNQQEPFQYCKLVMLTFAEDGKLFAEELAKDLARKKINTLPFGVVILQNHKNDIVSNAEEFIIHLFPQMDYVIPILTAGYFRALSDERFSSSNLLDERYIKFIHDLMNKYYTKNQCRNKKVRCIIPNKDKEIVHNNARFKNEPVLNSAWYNENNIEEFLISLIQR